MKFSVRYLAKAAMIAALYVLLTLLSAAVGLSSGAVQVRISEMLCILPLYTSAAIPGVTVGCFIANLLCGGTVYDVIFGTAATLIGVLLAALFKKLPYLAFVPTVLSNAAIIPAVLIVSGLGGWAMFPYFALTVGLGEVIACGLFGCAMILYIEKHPSVRKMLSD